MVQQCAQICNTARQIAGCPGYTVQSGQALNEALAFVCETQQFDYARGEFQFNFNLGLTDRILAPGCGPYLLPADWFRANFREIWFYDVGIPHQLVSVDSYQYDQAIQQSGLQSYPTIYTTMLEGVPPAPNQPPAGPPAIKIWSPPQSNYLAIARYQRTMPDIVSPELSPSLPWFPYTEWLVLKTAANLMRITDDTREDAYHAKAEKVMSAILKLANDNTGRAKTVKLDPRRFGPGVGAMLPNTKEWWIGGPEF